MIFCELDRNLLENERWWPDAHMNPTSNSKGLSEPLKFIFSQKHVEILHKKAGVYSF